MKGFNLIEKGKLIVAIKKANVYQLKEIKEMCENELDRRKRVERKALKKC